MSTTTTASEPAVLTIAGSDSGGGAGIQADLKTFAALGVFGTTAITCVTAQNPKGVSRIAAIDPDMVRQQIHVVCEEFPIAAAKTGMLFTADVIRAVAAAMTEEGLAVLVVDPVMVSSSGARLLKAEATEALCRDLLPQARVITPNLHEAEILCGHSIASVEDLRQAARDICERYDVACVAKGAHLLHDEKEIIDVLFDEGEEFVFKGPRIPDAETHGAGCSFSAAITAFLARGMHLSEAVVRAKHYVSRALRHAVQVGGHRPLNFDWAARDGGKSPN